jgi:hypothetical protein
MTTYGGGYDYGTVFVMPEPSTTCLLGAGILWLLAVYAFRRWKRAA